MSTNTLGVPDIYRKMFEGSEDINTCPSPSSVHEIEGVKKCVHYLNGKCRHGVNDSLNIECALERGEGKVEKGMDFQFFQW